MLRRYRPEDETGASALFCDPEVMRYVGDGRALTASEASDLFQRIFAKYATDPAFHIWAVDVDDRFAGHAELKRRDGRTEYAVAASCACYLKKRDGNASRR